MGLNAHKDLRGRLRGIGAMIKERCATCRKRVTSRKAQHGLQTMQKWWPLQWQRPKALLEFGERWCRRDESVFVERDPLAFVLLRVRTQPGKFPVAVDASRICGAHCRGCKRLPKRLDQRLVKIRWEAGQHFSSRANSLTSQ